MFECVPNISEGRRANIIYDIAGAIRENENAGLLHIDQGFDPNRTVLTWLASTDGVLETGFELIKRAAHYIDMSQQQGSHPRIGATDVFPIIALEEHSKRKAAEIAIKLARRVGEELEIPVFLYELSASSPERTNLEAIRKGQLAGITERMKNGYKPDFGPDLPHPTAGVTVMGVREFLIAYNINLKTEDERIAKKIAAKMRTSGAMGEPGLLPNLKAIGWHMPRFNCAQVSFNLTNFRKTSVHEVFDLCRELAEEHGTEVTGSELVGLIPEDALLMAGRHYLKDQNADDTTAVDKAIQQLKLNALSSFDPHERILQWKIKNEGYIFS